MSGYKMVLYNIYMCCIYIIYIYIHYYLDLKIYNTKICKVRVPEKMSRVCTLLQSFYIHKHTHKYIYIFDTKLYILVITFSFLFLFLSLPFFCLLSTSFRVKSVYIAVTKHQSFYIICLARCFYSMLYKTY